MKIHRAEPLLHYGFDDVRRGLLDRLFVKRKKERPNFNRRMFEEDFARIFKYANRHGGRLFNIFSSDEELIKRLLSNVQTRYGPHHSIDKTVREWVEAIAQSFIWSGAACYYLKADVEHDGIYITPLGSNGVAQFFGKHFQWVSQRTIRHWDRDDEEVPREIRILDSAKVMCFMIPKAIKRMLSLQNRTLAVIDKHQFGTDFQSQATHENPNPTNHFDFSVWQETQELALYRSTRATGWNGRKYDSSKRSDFFDCHRLIRFRRNQLVLRDDILNQLSAELSRVGKGYNAEFAVEISGTDELSSVAYLNELEARLTREEAGFTEIFDYCLKR